ncbi:50S ribosomal protein L18 [Candidatus Providencia siddallii]|uniref:Large ribosomal subunit protein uL18 n=1 Tax=Candidatus Providencia siddallii TaxID=1715285 RepID=A0A0M6W952_9GAMM|nr:50S ribosomal protein L18 [Candidatus Providencia siddallii]
MNKKSARIRRATRTRQNIKELGLTRLVVHRTSRHIYAQIITANKSVVVAAASTTEKSINKQVNFTGNKDAAALVGKSIAEKTIMKGITKIAFDRSGFKYHGRVQALAEAARKAGLHF